MSPAICIQEMMLYPEKKTVLSSDLLVERKARMRKNKKRGWAKIQLEILRLIKQLKLKIKGVSVSYR